MAGKGSGWAGTTHTNASMAGYVKIDEQTAVPSAVVFEATGDNGHPDITARFEVRDGRPECVDVHFRAKPKGRAITEADMGRLRVEQMAVEMFALWAMKYERTATGTAYTRHSSDSPAGTEVQRWAEREMFERQQRVRRPPSALELEQVATVYREHVDDRPTAAVQREMGYASQRTAARRVQQARDAGLLPPTTPGKRRA